MRQHNSLVPIRIEHLRDKQNPPKTLVNVTLGVDHWVDQMTSKVTMACMA